MPAPVPITAWHWAGFILVIFIFLALDLGIFHRTARAIKFKEALFWTSIWVILALLFARGIEHWRGEEESLQFLTGYVIEFSLSMDNVFAIAMIFAAFGVRAANQHRVLHWGIAGAVVMRGAMIVAGAAALRMFHWVFPILGAFLVVTGIHWAFSKGAATKPGENFIVRFARRFFRVSGGVDDVRFVTRDGTGWALTPLALVLLSVETADLVFAVDSIPAIFSVTQNAFIVFTSNMFAILGLRSLYFVLAEAVEYFRYLRIGLAVILVFIGVKMLLAQWHPIGTTTSLAVILGIFAVSIGVSIATARLKEKAPN